MIKNPGESGTIYQHCAPLTRNNLKTFSCLPDPPEITVESPVVYSGEGQEAMLVCIVHGEAQPEVSQCRREEHENSLNWKHYVTLTCCLRKLNFTEVGGMGGSLEGEAFFEVKFANLLIK